MALAHPLLILVALILVILRAVGWPPVAVHLGWLGMAFFFLSFLL